MRDPREFWFRPPSRSAFLQRRRGMMSRRPAIGVTLDARVMIQNRNEVLIDSGVDELKNVWNSALEHLLHEPVLV